MAAYPKKLYCLDTNVLMHDPLALFAFEEHDVFIPFKVVEELDRLKTKHYAAREVARHIRSLIEARGQNDLRDGIPFTHLQKVCGSATGRLHVSVKDSAESLNADNNIIYEVSNLKGTDWCKDHEIIFVTKDNLAYIRAFEVSLYAEDYKTDRVEDIESLNETTIRNDRFFDELTGDPEYTRLEGRQSEVMAPVAEGAELARNTYLFVGEDEYRVLASEPGVVKLRPLSNIKVWGIEGRNPGQIASLDALMDPEVHIVALTGLAGSGKTLLTLAAGLEQIVERKTYYRMCLTRSLQDLDEQIGFLPGTEAEKMQPWMGAFLDNAEVLMDDGDSERALDTALNDVLSRASFMSLNFMRGRSFLKRWIVVDEAQNLTPHHVKTLVTRVGEGSKIILLGNNDQIDNPRLTPQTTGLSYLISRMKGWKRFAHVHLEGTERSEVATAANERL